MDQLDDAFLWITSLEMEAGKMFRASTWPLVRAGKGEIMIEMNVTSTDLTSPYQSRTMKGCLLHNNITLPPLFCMGVGGGGGDKENKKCKSVCDMFRVFYQLLNKKA